MTTEGEGVTEHIYVWLAKDLDGCDGIIAYPTPMGVMPLMATDEAIARSFRPNALEAARRRHQTARLVVFHKGHILDTTGPYQ